jgi:poly(hydroxyalkanoate) granule-associated protein
MIKKLNEPAGEGGESGLVSTIRESATKIWLAGLGAFSKGQEEGGKFFETLVREGEAVQNRASKSAQDAISEARTKATGAWDKLEQVFVERVQSALHSLDVPTKQDIHALSKRVQELTKVADKLSAHLEETRSAAKPKSKKSSGRTHT